MAEPGSGNAPHEGYVRRFAPCAGRRNAAEDGSACYIEEVDRAVEELQKRAAAEPDVVGLCGGMPAPELLPRGAASRALAEVPADRATDALQYGWAEGDERLRGWVAARLAARGADLRADDVIITSGAQQALSLAAAELLGPGDRVGVGAASYPGALAAFAQAGAVATASDRAVAVHYLIAGASNPEGIDAVAARPDALAGDVPLIVDEAYAELRFDGVVPRPLLGREPMRGRVWHVGTVSKTLSPGLRVGWLVPPAAHRESILERKHAADLQAGSLAQAALAALLDELDYDRHVARAQRIYAERAARMLAALRRRAPSSWRFTEPEGGFAVWLQTDVPMDGAVALERAIAAGVSFDPGHLFLPSGDGDSAAEPLALRLSFSSAPIDELDRGVARLVASLAQVSGSA